MTDSQTFNRYPKDIPYFPFQSGSKVIDRFNVESSLDHQDPQVSHQSEIQILIDFKRVIQRTVEHPFPPVKRDIEKVVTTSVITELIGALIFFYAYVDNVSCSEETLSPNIMSA